MVRIKPSDRNAHCLVVASQRKQFDQLNPLIPKYQDYWSHTQLKRLVAIEFFSAMMTLVPTHSILYNALKHLTCTRCYILSSVMRLDLIFALSHMMVGMYKGWSIFLYAEWKTAHCNPEATVGNVPKLTFRVYLPGSGWMPEGISYFSK